MNRYTRVFLLSFSDYLPDVSAWHDYLAAFDFDHVVARPSLRTLDNRSNQAMNRHPWTPFLGIPELYGLAYARVAYHVNHSFPNFSSCQRLNAFQSGCLALGIQLNSTLARFVNSTPNSGSNFIQYAFFLIRKRAL